MDFIDKGKWTVDTPLYNWQKDKKAKTKKPQKAKPKNKLKMNRIVFK